MEKTIIIVEDDPFTQTFYKYVFAKTSYKTIVLEDGDVLLETVANESISMIIMDINLKNTFVNGQRADGVMLSKMIKENEKSNKIPILLVTAYQNNLGTNNFLEESKAEDYINKPIVDYNELLKKVNKLVNADE